MAEVAINRRARQLPVGPIGRRGVGWWGVGTLVASEARAVCYLLFSYFYTGATAEQGWLLEPRPRLSGCLRQYAAAAGLECGRVVGRTRACSRDGAPRHWSGSAAPS